MTDQKLRVEAADALDFLRNHPAINPEILGDSLFDGMWFSMVPCCKNGKSEWAKKGVTIYKGDEGWEKYKAQFDEEYKDDPNEELQTIDIPYEEKYGEPWEFDHVEYWYELTFWVFEGNPYHESEYMDYKNWGRYGGPEGGANTFEDMIIECAKEVEKAFGKFNLWNDFRTTEEEKNNSDQIMFFFEPCKDKPEYKEMIRNEQHVDIHNGLTNLRWLKWFVETDYAKENWPEYSEGKFREYIKKIEEMEPPERKAILKRYK